MKSVLISIQPKWCELIASGKKTIEVRKTAPKAAPFKVYIYQTKKKWIYRLFKKLGLYQGKVVGEFVCDKIIEYEGGVDYGLLDDRVFYCGTLAECTGLTRTECIEYGKKKIPIGWELQTLYGWHISNLKIYDTPKELGEFKRSVKKCTNGVWYSVKEQIKRPQQSWCYVEDLG